MRTLALVLLILSAAVPCFAQTFTISPVSNCPDLPDGFSLGLGPGTYNIEYVSGAWSPISDDALYGGYAWASHIRIYIYATGQSGYIGTPYTLYQSPQLAEAAAKGIYILIIPTNTIVSFWLPEVVNNFNDCSDNRGSVTLRFIAPLAVRPTTWGAVKALYQ
jgi:hypothetical protein